MAKIILQASSFKKNYDIETIAITSSDYRNSGSLTLEIKPHKGYTVDASDFYSGLLGKNIVNVTYSNSKRIVDFDNKINVNITLGEDILLEGGKNVVVFIPVNGAAKSPSNELVFIDETEQAEGITVIDRLGSVTLVDSSITQDLHANTYHITGAAGESGMIIQKIFEADNGYYISKVPKWSLKSRLKDNYSIVVREHKDEAGGLVKKVYEISYTFPKDKFIAKYQDKIIFN